MWILRASSSSFGWKGVRPSSICLASGDLAAFLRLRVGTVGVGSGDRAWVVGTLGDSATVRRRVEVGLVDAGVLEVSLDTGGEIAAPWRAKSRREIWLTGLCPQAPPATRVELAGEADAGSGSFLGASALVNNGCSEGALIAVGADRSGQPYRLPWNSSSRLRFWP